MYSILLFELQMYSTLFYYLNYKCTLFFFFFKGHPAPTIEWFHDGEMLQDGDEVEIIEEREGQCLVIWEAGSQHKGQYTCRAVNDSGMAEVHVTATVIKKGQFL